jgi:hypothetical protein
MPVQPAVATINAGESLSNAVNLASTAVAVVIAPPDWTPANISFQLSVDNVTFGDLFDNAGTEVVRTFVPGTAVVVDRSLTDAALYVKIRSGPRDKPVVQQVQRKITLGLV